MKANIEKAIDNFYLEQEKFEHYYDEFDKAYIEFETEYGYYQGVDDTYWETNDGY